MQNVAVRPVLLLTVGVLGLVACSSPQAGTALSTSGAPTGTGGVQPPSAGPAASPPSGPGTSAIEPCSLLGVDDIAQYGTFGAPVKKSLAGARICRYERNITSASDGILTISIDVRDAQGVSTVNDIGGGTKTGKVNDRKAVKAEGPASSACILALAVGDASRVDVSVNAGDSQKACDIATKVADIVEPKLPKG